MRRLWRDYCEHASGVDNDGIQQLVSEIAGVDLAEFLQELIYGTGELPLQQLLQTVGVEVNYRLAGNQKDKGGKPVDGELAAVDFAALLKQDKGGLEIQRVSEAGSAQSAGLSAGDVIIAVNGLKLSLEQFEKQLLLAQPGDCWQVHAFRRDELNQFEVRLQQAQPSSIVLAACESQIEQRLAWLQN